MLRPLLLTSAACAGIAVACLTGAGALITHDLSTSDWTLISEKFGDHIRVTRAAPSLPEPTETKTLSFAGDSVTIDLPVDVTYVQAPDAHISVTGPASQIARVVFKDGRLSLSDGQTLNAHDDRVTLHLGANGLEAVHDGTERLHVTITAPSVKKFAVEGSGNLDIRGYDQPTMDVRLTGSGNLNGGGHTKTLTLAMAGSGDADLSALAATDTSVNLSGSGDAELNTSGKLTSDLTGSGDVRFHGHPKTVESKIVGSGSVEPTDDDRDGDAQEN
ncbi:GIN domain-containing protein [Asticcacaulis solisilvae]|uniref:GIN domain-containing protein n=1 Tax=Asticcacaulis solisilvae TaxID=1217274 RepID=UPI003FD7B682